MTRCSCRKGKGIGRRWPGQMAPSVRHHLWQVVPRLVSPPSLTLLLLAGPAGDGNRRLSSSSSALVPIRNYVGQYCDIYDGANDMDRVVEMIRMGAERGRLASRFAISRFALE